MEIATDNTLLYSLFGFKVHLEKTGLSKSSNWFQSHSVSVILELKCWAMMFALTMSGALVWSHLLCLQASRPEQPLIVRAVRRPVITGSLGRLLCSLIDGLSVWSNYPRQDWEAGDFVDCPVHIKVYTPKNADYMCKQLGSKAVVSDYSQKVKNCLTEMLNECLYLLAKKQKSALRCHDVKSVSLGKFKMLFRLLLSISI